jgi:hypothetical protein
MNYDWEVQSALYRMLNSYTPLTNIAPVVDFGRRVDDGSTIFPYVAIGTIILTQFDTDTTNGFDMLARIHTWSDSGSAKQCRIIQGHIYNRLHKDYLLSAAFDSVLMYRDSTDVMQDANGTFHGICEYRAILDLA